MGEVINIREPVQVNIGRKVTTTISARARVGTKSLLVSSLRSGIKIKIDDGNNWPSNITIPEALIESLADVFIAVKAAREEEGKND